MAASINKVVLIGNVGKDPEIRLTQDGKEIINFSLATSDSWRDKITGEKKEKTEWHKIVVFVPQLVQIIKNYIKKGSKVYIEGSLQTRKWLDHANVEKFVTEIVLQSYNSTIVLLDNAGNRDAAGGHDGSSGYDSNGGSGNYGSSGDYGSGKGGRAGDGTSPSTYSVEDLNDEIPF